MMREVRCRKGRLAATAQLTRDNPLESFSRVFVGIGESNLGR